MSGPRCHGALSIVSPPRLGLPVLIAPQVAVRRAVRADVDLPAEAVHGRAGGLDAVGLPQVAGQLLVGPVGPVEALLGRAVDDPAADLVGQAVGDLGGG